MNRNSNSYTFLFASIMVIIVGTLISVASISLKEKQNKNLREEKMKNILMAARIMTRKQDMSESTALFNKYVEKQFILDANGNQIEKDYTAFDIDVKKKYKNWKAGIIKSENLEYPLFKVINQNKTIYVVPTVGTGLWGPIWGYLAFEDDFNTIYGVSFDHKTETPGLGAEINTSRFQDKFIGKKIFDNNNFVSISISKRKIDKNDNHAVDGITGGTITSTGVDEMIRRTLQIYVPYFINHKKF